jgi:SNF2 family DNA or RNA helicase
VSELPLPSPSPPPAHTDADGWRTAADSKWARLPGGFKLSRKLYDSLYAYQREGVAWMWSLHEACPAPSGSLGRGTERLGAGGGGAPCTPSCAAAALGALPRKLCGGILADDMGLGQTLQAIGRSSRNITRQARSENGIHTQIIPVEINSRKSQQGLLPISRHDARIAPIG